MSRAFHAGSSNLIPPAILLMAQRCAVRVERLPLPFTQRRHSHHGVKARYAQAC